LVHFFYINFVFVHFFRRYSEFQKFLLPKSISFKKLYEERDEINQGISNKSTLIIERLMKKTLEGENRWRLILEKLKSKFEKFIEKSFGLLDQNCKGFLTIDDMRTFLNSMELFPTSQEMEILYSRLDPYNEGIISLKDYARVIEN